MRSFLGRDILSLKDFERADFERVFEVCDKLAPMARDRRNSTLLARKTLLTAFYQPSTRTRLATEAAMHRLGGHVLGFADAKMTRAGDFYQESIKDTVHMLEYYGDVIAMRHFQQGAPAEAAKWASVPIINCGDGWGEHPTQVLTDLYTIWRELGRFLQRYVKPGARVVDIACDLGYFIRNIRAADRWATDIRDVGASLPKDVHFVSASGLDLARVLPNDHFDVAFFSNYLEHLPSTEAVLEQLRVTFSILKPGGTVVILQPNIRLIGGAYWDFIDHQTALTDKSLSEAARMAGFETKQVIARFLPYTTKSRLPQSAALVRAYLAFPPAWLLFGRQTLYLGEKPATG